MYGWYTGDAKHGYCAAFYTLTLFFLTEYFG
jgi:hypothetical protein